MSTTLDPPFPWFGAKPAHVIAWIWQALGDDINHLVDPFFGAGRFLLQSPYRPIYETVNDKYALLTNTYRAIAADPEAVAATASYPVSELDLHARRQWLARREPVIRALSADPDYYDVQAAGWWLWAIAQWIGSGFERADRRQLPRLSGAQGILRTKLQSPEALRDYLMQLATRLRSVRIVCGDWLRVLTPSALSPELGQTGIVLDPAYGYTGRTVGLYPDDTDPSLPIRVRDWAMAHGNRPHLRIVVCGAFGEHTFPVPWTAWHWQRRGGYANQGSRRNDAQSKQETVWLSPHCWNPQTRLRQESLFILNEVIS